MTTLDIPEPKGEIECVEIFHQQTKFYPSTNANCDRRIATHLCDQRAILEASTNRKRFFGRETIALPTPTDLTMSLGETIKRRRSCRAFSGRRLSLQDLSNLLGTLRVTAQSQSAAFPDITLTLRSYPSGGGLYPVETYIAWKNPETGVTATYHYSPHDHTLTEVKADVSDEELKRVMADHNHFTKDIGCAIFFTGVFRRTLTKYGIPGYRFIMIEAGEMAQQIALASCASGWSTLFWGGSYDDYVNELLEVDGVNETLILSLMVGEQRDV